MTNKILFRLCMILIVALSLCLTTTAQDPTGREIPKVPTPKPPKPKSAKKKKNISKPRKSRPSPASRNLSEPAPMGPRLTIVAPPGALIEIDGRARGFVGVDGNLLLTNIKTGEHQINFLAEGYEPWQGSFTMGPSATRLEVPARKKPGTGRIALTSNESGVEIFIDNKPGGKSMAGETVLVDGIPPGPHQLRGVKEGFQEATLSVTVIPEETQEVKLVLKPVLDPPVLRVPDGVFRQGNNSGSREQRPARRVFTSEFEISSREITNRLYKWFIDATGHPAPSGEGSGWKGNQYPEGKDNQPVVFVSWADAMAFCKWLSEQTGMQYRLPTEAEWEKAASMLGDQYSSIGNIWEWCYDWYDPDAYRSRERTNPRGPLRGKIVRAVGREGEARVIRGGSFGREAAIIRAAERNYFFPESSRSDIGFRVVREITQ